MSVAGADAGQTPAQTIGPFFHDGLLDRSVDHLDPDGLAGTPIVVTGAIRDGAGQPVGDAMLEVWQADGTGRYRHPADGRAADVPSAFIGFGRVGTTREDGAYTVTTVRPGTVPGREPGTIQAPHLSVHLFARGLLDKLSTRIYLDDEVEANAADPVLAQVSAERRGTLVARRDGEVDGVARYRFDIVLQGPDETVFFDA